MRIAILGAGFTGLSAGYYLAKAGHSVTVFEKDTHPGGLAVGFNNLKWEWSLEKHYHHWFTNDKYVLSLAKEIGFKVVTKRPTTAVFINHQIHPFDSPVKILRFPHLSHPEKARMLAAVALLRYNPLWRPLERFAASKVLPKMMGEKAYQMIWKPQLINKFGRAVDEVSLAWFWARIKKRTTSLSYPEGGFLFFAQSLQKAVEDLGGEFFYKVEVLKITQEYNGVWLNVAGTKQRFDKVIVTSPTYIFTKITPQLPPSYTTSLKRLKGLGAINLVLRLKQPFFKDKTYWLSVCDLDSPVMAVVEHTNFMDPIHYNNEHLVYLGNYLPADHEYFQKTPQELLKIYDPFIKKINPDYRKFLIGVEKFEAPFAQPIIPINYSKIIPEMRTPLKDVYLANIEQVYPWDRGTNYAVELGMRVSKLI